MANPLPKPAGIQRLRIGANVVLQTIIVAVIVLMVNYIGFNRYQRWDLSRFNKYALSELTKKLLKSLKKEVKIYVFLFPNISERRFRTLQ